MTASENNQPWAPVQLLRGAVAILVLLPLLVLFSRPAGAQEADETPDQVVLFVLDLSGSMNEPFDDERSKLDVAKAAFVEAFTNVSPDALVGLRVYGDQLPATAPADRAQNCTEDSRLVVPISPLKRQQLINEVQGFSALGDTAIGLALEQANADIPQGAVGTVVLFSDGRDECFDADLDGVAATGPSFGKDPCAVATEIAGEGDDLRIDRVVTVGFRADAAAAAELQCIANSTGGSYTAIETPADARDVLPELLAELSSPREAERLGGRPIEGTPTREGAPELVRLDAPGSGDGRYTDSIAINSHKWYHVSEFGPEGGTFTATVFGLPAQEAIRFDMRLYLPSADQFFFTENADENAGIPLRPTASIRCTECFVTNGPHEAFWVVSLTTPNESLEGSFELELATEGPGFGGSSTSCDEPQECWYPAEIDARTAQLEEMRTQLAELTPELAPEDMLAERAALEAEVGAAQDAMNAATERADEIEALIATAPSDSTSLMLPLLMVLIGLLVAFVPLPGSKKKSPKKAKEPAEKKLFKTNEEAAADAMRARLRPKSEADAQVFGQAAPAQVDPGEQAHLDARQAAARAEEEAAAQAQAAAAAAAAEEAAQAQAEMEAAHAQAEAEEQARAEMEAIHARVIADAESTVAAASTTTTPSAPAEPDTGAVLTRAEDAEAASAQTTPAGWYEDPLSPSQYRWWSGAKWTEHTSTNSAGGE